MLLETVTMPHMPATHSVHVALFRDVSNAEFLQRQLLAHNPDFEYAFVDASALASRLHLLAAVHATVQVDAAPGGLRTPNVHSEIVLALGATNNAEQIAEAYRRHGITPGTTRHIAVVKVLRTSPTTSTTSTTPEADARAAVERHLLTYVEGEAAPLTDAELALITDWAKLKRYHKLNSAPVLASIEDEGARRREMEMLILGGMALRGI